MDSLLTTYFDGQRPVDDLRICAVSALRSLLSDTPSRVESIWATRYLFIGYPDGQWFEIHSPGRIWYMQVGRSGRYSRTRPSGVSDSQLAKVTAPSPPHLGIREFLDVLAGRFDSVHDVEFGNLLHELSPVLRAMGNGSFDTSEVNCFLQGCYDLLQSGKSAAPFFEKYASDLTQRYLSFHAPGYLVAYMVVLDRCLRLMPKQPIVDFMLVSLNPPGSAILDKIRSVNDLLALVLKALLGEAGEAQAVAEAIKSMQDAGEQLIQDAKAGDSVDDFYGKLYESSPWLYGAFRGYQLLANTSKHLEEKRQYSAAVTFCEELSVRVRTSLDQIFGNWVGTGFVEDVRRQIALVRSKDGDFAAEMLVDQHIDGELLFPPFWKPFLLGATSTLPMRRS